MHISEKVILDPVKRQKGWNWIRTGKYLHIVRYHDFVFCYDFIYYFCSVNGFCLKGCHF